MGVPVTFLSSNTRSALGSAITALIASETYLVVPWSDVSGALGSNSPPPDSLEDWLAAINYTLVDKVLADTNSQTQAKITASRRFITQVNGKGLESFFESGTDLAAYQLTTTIYTVDSNPIRPPAANL